MIDDIMLFNFESVDTKPAKGRKFLVHISTMVSADMSKVLNKKSQVLIKISKLNLKGQY